MIDKGEKFNLISYDLSKDSIQRLSLNYEDLPQIRRYSGDHTVTASTSLSTASVPQTSLQSTSLTEDSLCHYHQHHSHNGMKQCKFGFFFK